jgi:hypothetical protein
VKHPPISFVLKRHLEDPNDEEYVAHLLVHVTFQPQYPLHVTPPNISIVWFLLTQKSMMVSSNKPLDSTNQGILDETKLLQDIAQHSSDYLLGMPSVYELLDTWLSENLFHYIIRTSTL